MGFFFISHTLYNIFGHVMMSTRSFLGQYLKGYVVVGGTISYRIGARVHKQFVQTNTMRPFGDNFGRQRGFGVTIMIGNYFTMYLRIPQIGRVCIIGVDHYYFVDRVGQITGQRVPGQRDFGFYVSNFGSTLIFVVGL